MRLCVLLVLLALAQPAGGPPYSPQDALSSFRVEPGFRIELVASEPDIASPVAMDIDEDGRWFVVEMPGYPLDVSPTGRVKLLEDTNGDGRPDRATVFADRLVLPTGVMRWKRGIIVTAAPDLLYFEDTDGDGRADVRKVLVTGFAVTNPQHSVNGPTYALDNWIDVAYSGGGGALIYPELFGDRGKPLTFPDRPDIAAVDPKSRSVRVRLDSPAISVRSGRTQFGTTFDAWGRYFTSSNNDHIRHEVVAARYLERNPSLAVAAAMHDISDHGAAAKVFPVTDRPRYELLTESGEFTSACALTMYTGGLFEGEYAHSSFVAEPVHNLVHRDVVVPSGATFTAQRGGAAGREFLASTDAWFRPVNFYVGPDGALYVIDYYRPRIEHPEWTASEFHKNPEQFSQGRDRGRIYRVLPESTAAGAPNVPSAAGPNVRPAVAGPNVRPAVGPNFSSANPALGTAGEPQLIEALSHPNLWWRRTAQRLLVDRRSATSVPALKALARDGRSPLGRLHALWTLEGIGRLDDVLVARALGDAHPGVRESALQLAEARMAGDGIVAAATLARVVVEQDARVRFQLLATLGGLDTPESRAAQQRLLFNALDDRWMHAAALSAGPDRSLIYLQAALAPDSVARSRDSESHRAFFALTASAVAAGQDAASVQEIVETAAANADEADAWWQAAMLEGLARGTRSGPIAGLSSSRPALVALAERQQTQVRRAALALLARTGLEEVAAATAARERAIALMSNDFIDADRRADAIAFVALGDVAAVQPQLRALIDPRQPEVVQVAALKALGALKGEDPGTFVLNAWPQLTPAARLAAVDLLLGDPDRQRMLVRALKAGAVQSWTMSFWQKRALIMHRDPELRASARALLEDRPEARAEIVNRYAGAVEKGGDAGRGAAVFSRACAACHKLGGGTPADLGPDLASIRHRPPLALLVDILSPNQSIAQGYETYVIERAGGRTDAGTLAEQTPTTVTLRQAGQPIVVARTEIKQITMMPQSSMPADLDKVIEPGEMADLLAYLTKR